MVGTTTDGRMRIGIVLQLADEDERGNIRSYASIREVALAAEAAGLNSAWSFVI